MEINECQSNPCQNNGTCYVSYVNHMDNAVVTSLKWLLHIKSVAFIILQDLLNDYVCVCVAGWEGKDCQVETNECDSNPCINGATCVVSKVLAVLN